LSHRGQWPGQAVWEHVGAAPVQPGPSLRAPGHRRLGGAGGPRRAAPPEAGL